MILAHATGANILYATGWITMMMTAIQSGSDNVKIVVTGAAGMLGSKLIARLAKDGSLAGRKIQHILRHDVVLPAPPPPSVFSITTEISSLASSGAAAALVSGKPDVIFHLAAVVSGEAESSFEKGYSVNFDGTRSLLEAIRTTPGYCPKLVFTSSIAVFGRPFPETIPDDFLCAPLTSYGTQKAACELLLADYTKKGYISGIGLRMPTVCVRPGKPNLAASGFFSNIIREPLAGHQAVLPVSDSVRHWHISPRGAIDLLIHACAISAEKFGNRPNLTMPGLCCSVAEQIEALRGVAGNDVVKLIKRQPDERIATIVAGWPQNFAADRARALGFKSENSFQEIIRIHLEDDRIM